MVVRYTQKPLIVVHAPMNAFNTEHLVEKLAAREVLERHVRHRVVEQFAKTFESPALLEVKCRHLH